MNKPDLPLERRVLGRLSILAGNALQIAGMAVACLALEAARSASSNVSAIVAMIAAWILLYFFCHGIAHWAVGRLLGIRFAFYTVGGTGRRRPARTRLQAGGWSRAIQKTRNGSAAIACGLMMNPTEKASAASTGRSCTTK